MYLPSIIHILLLLLFLLQMSIHLYPGQTRLGLCSFQHQNESATLLGKQHKVQSCCVSRKEKKGIFSDMCSVSCLSEDKMNQRNSGYILPLDTGRLVENLRMTPTTKAGPNSVKLMATSQFGHKQFAF